MLTFLEKRSEQLTELMEDPNCDKKELFNTYEQFSHVNGLISRWKTLFDAYIAPLAGRKTLTILDIGCGGGDICLKFAEWGEQKNLDLSITGIDPDPRAIEYTKTLNVPENVEFRQKTSTSLVRNREYFDVVISNHLIHHMKNSELLEICRETEAITRKLALFNDIRRSKIGYTAFACASPVVYRSSFIVQDGKTSIRRSFTYRELKRIVPPPWKVKKLFPFRLLLVYEV